MQRDQYRGQEGVDAVRGKDFKDGRRWERLEGSNGWVEDPIGEPYNWSTKRNERLRSRILTTASADAIANITLWIDNSRAGPSHWPAWRHADGEFPSTVIAKTIGAGRGDQRQRARSTGPGLQNLASRHPTASRRAWSLKGGHEQERKQL